MKKSEVLVRDFFQDQRDGRNQWVVQGGQKGRSKETVALKVEWMRESLVRNLYLLSDFFNLCVERGSKYLGGLSAKRKIETQQHLMIDYGHLASTLLSPAHYLLLSNSELVALVPILNALRGVAPGTMCFTNLSNCNYRVLCNKSAEYQITASLVALSESAYQPFVGIITGFQATSLVALRPDVSHLHSNVFVLPFPLFQKQQNSNNNNNYRNRTIYMLQRGNRSYRKCSHYIREVLGSNLSILADAGHSFPQAHHSLIILPFHVVQNELLTASLNK